MARFLSAVSAAALAVAAGSTATPIVGAPPAVTAAAVTAVAFAPFIAKAQDDDDGDDDGDDGDDDDDDDDDGGDPDDDFDDPDGSSGDDDPDDFGDDDPDDDPDDDLGVEIDDPGRVFGDDDDDDDDLDDLDDLDDDFQSFSIEDDDISDDFTALDDDDDDPDLDGDDADDPDDDDDFDDDDRGSDDDDDAGSAGGRRRGDDDARFGAGGGNQVRGGRGVRGVARGGGRVRDPDAVRRRFRGEDEEPVDPDGFRVGDDVLLALDLNRSEIALARDLGFDVVDSRRLAGLDTVLTKLRPPADLSVPNARDALRQAAPAAPFDYNHLYGLPDTGATAVSLAIDPPKLTRPRGEGATIGIIDTLLDPTHPSLRGQNIVVRDFAKGRGRDRAHATAVASIIAGFDPDTGYEGLAVGAKLVAANVFWLDRNGAPRTDIEALIQAFDFAAAQEAGVINVSIAGPPSALLEGVVARLTRRGVLVVAAVGNDGPAAPPLYPAAYDAVIAVTAVDLQGQVYRRAGRGQHVDVAAPGVGLRAAGPTSNYVSVTGTSFATPVVAALLALQSPRPNPATALEARRLLDGARDLGDPGRDAVFGVGLIQMRRPDAARPGGAP